LEFDRLCAEIEADEGVGSGYMEILEIVDETELEVCEVLVGPQIELNLGEGNSVDDVEPVIEVPQGVPMVEVEDDGSSVEVISARESISDQAEGTGAVPVPDDAKMKAIEEVVGTSVPVSCSEVRSGVESDPMDVDMPVRTGEEPVLEEGVAGIGSELGPGDSIDRTGEAPVQ